MHANRAHREHRPIVDPWPGAVVTISQRAAAHGVTVLNATPVSAIEVFPRVTLDEVLSP